MVAPAVLNGELGEAVRFTCAAVATRELSRGIAWMASNGGRLTTGPTGRLRDFASLSLSAFAVGLLDEGGGSLGYELVTGHTFLGGKPETTGNILLIGASLLTFYVAGLGPTGTGLRDVIGSYTEVLWNHPSKVPKRPRFEPLEDFANDDLTLSD